MRIRLRVPMDGGENSSGLGGWLRRLRDALLEWPGLGESGTRDCKRQIDKRWATRGNAKHFFEGRLCRNNGGGWQSEYVFSILAAGDLLQMRVVLPEAPVGMWEKQYGQRMSEERRLQLARETMEALLDLCRYPAAAIVSADAVAAAPPGEA